MSRFRNIGDLQGGEIFEYDRGPLDNLDLIRLDAARQDHAIPLTEENLDVLEELVEEGRDRL